MRFTLIGCGGLVALFVLLGIVSAVIGGGGGGTAGSGGDNAPNKPAEKREDQAGPDELEEEAQKQEDQAQQQQDEFEKALDEAEQQQAQEQPQEEPPAQEEDTGMVFRVTGDRGLRFQGSIATTDVQRTVQGVTPKDYPLEGVDTGLLSNDVVSANAQKMTAGRQTLTVQIVVDGEVVKKASTSANYGVAQVTWSAAE